MPTHLRLAFIGLVDEDLGHPLDGDGEGDDGVVQRARRDLLRGTPLFATGVVVVVPHVRPSGAECAEYGITGFAEKKFLQGGGSSLKVHTKVRSQRAKTL